MWDSSASDYAALSEADHRRFVDIPPTELNTVSLRHALAALIRGEADVLAQVRGERDASDPERGEQVILKPKILASCPRIEVFEAWLACALLDGDGEDPGVDLSLEHWTALSKHYGDREDQIEEDLVDELKRRSFDRTGGLPEKSERSFLIDKTREGDVQSAARLELLAFGLRELLLWRWARLVRDEKTELAEMTLRELEREKKL